MGVKERRLKEKKLRHDQILDAARKLLFSTGIKNISINKIADESELSVGTIYFYFKNKEDIFVSLQEEGLGILHKQILNVYEQDIPYSEKLKQMGFEYLEFSNRYNDYFDILNYFLSASNVMLKREAKNIVLRSGKKILLLIENIVKQGIEKGEFKKIHPKKYSVMFWGSIHGMIQFRKLENTSIFGMSYKAFYDFGLNNLINVLKN